MRRFWSTVIALSASSCATCPTDLVQRCVGNTIEQCGGGKWRAFKSCPGECKPADDQGPAFCASDSIMMTVDDGGIKIQVSK